VTARPTLRHPRAHQPVPRPTPGAGTRVRWWLEYVAVLGLYAFLAVLPCRVRLGLGRILGRLVYRIDRRHRDIALDNLTMAYPDAADAWRRTIALGSFENLGRLLVEVLMLRRDAARMVAEDEVEGWDYVTAYARAGTGYFLMSGHFGNWERAAFTQGLRGVPLWMVARPLDNPHLERLLAGIRGATGNRIIHKRSGIKETVKGLKSGRPIAFVIDQDFPESGPHFVPYFGKLASTTPALGTVATRLGAPVLPIFAYPKPAGGYRIVYGPPIPTAGIGPDEAGAVAMTAAATACIEQAVRRCPQAWFWMHQRWRTRPLDEPLDGDPQ
jgi:Kdo2-lipid IVA lauroyltransferase/acyltransferase